MNTIPRSALRQLSDLSDQDLLAHLHLAAQAERDATAHLVALLTELDGRRLYLGEGFPSRRTLVFLASSNHHVVHPGKQPCVQLIGVGVDGVGEAGHLR